MTEERVLSLPFGLRLDAAEVRRHPAALEGVLLDLYERLHPALLGYVSQLVGSPTEAEDVLQVTFLRLFDALQQGKEIENARAWIYRVAHNLALDAARREQHSKSIDGAWLAERDATTTSTPEAALIQREAIHRALGGLNERERHCLLLRAEGLRHQEIGEVIGVSTKAVSVYLARGLKKFAKDYDISHSD